MVLVSLAKKTKKPERGEKGFGRLKGFSNYSTERYVSWKVRSTRIMYPLLRFHVVLAMLVGLNRLRTGALSASEII